MSVTGEHVVKLALAHVGAHEVPMGSNRGVFVQECQAATGYPGTGWPWCAGFICRVAHEAGLNLPYKSAGAHDLADHYPDLSLEHAKPGDVIDFNIGSGHTGILIEKLPGYVRSVDGNWADAVTVVEHPNSTVRRIWRMPGVDDSPPKRKRVRRPFFSVATSHKGHRVVLARVPTKRRVVRWLYRHSLGHFPNGITVRKHA